MHQQQNSTKPITLILLLLSFTSMNAQAAFNDSRVEKWEFYLAPKLTNSKVLQFENGAEADINKRSSLAFGFGYNINAHIELSMEFGSSSANYTSTVIPEDPAESPQQSTQSLYTSSLNLGFTYNFLSRPFYALRYSQHRFHVYRLGNLYRQRGHRLLVLSLLGVCLRPCRTDLHHDRNKLWWRAGAAL